MHAPRYELRLNICYRYVMDPALDAILNPWAGSTVASVPTTSIPAGGKMPALPLLIVLASVAATVLVYIRK